MTPPPATAIDGSASGKELPGAMLQAALAGADAAPFSAALAIFQDPLLSADGQDKPPTSQDGGDQNPLLLAPADPSAAALAAVLQWLRQSAGSEPLPAHDHEDSKPAAADGAVIAGVAGGNAAAAGPLPALVAAHLKGSARSTNASAIDSAANRGAAGSAADPAGTAAAAAAATATGAPGSPGAAVAAAINAINNPTAKDLQSLANLIGQSGAGGAAPTAREDRGGEASASSLKPIDSLSTAGSDNSAGTAGAAATGLERGAAARGAAAAATPQGERVVSVPVHDRHWSQAIAAQVLVLADHRIESATLRLTPEHLGPVEVRIDIEDTQVNVSFGAAHSDTRSALEQALPRLREVLAGAGLTLGEASVQQQMRRGPQNRGESARGGGGAADQQSVTLLGGARALGMIDEYA
jgi:flagellar hook-length control protein FliK